MDNYCGLIGHCFSFCSLRWLSGLSDSHDSYLRQASVPTGCISFMIHDECDLIRGWFILRILLFLESVVAAGLRKWLETFRDYFWSLEENKKYDCKEFSYSCPSCLTLWTRLGTTNFRQIFIDWLACLYAELSEDMAWSKGNRYKEKSDVVVVVVKMQVQVKSL